MSNQVLMIFTRNPEAGKVKTRLAATIGIKDALIVYEQLVNQTKVVTEDLPLDKIVFYSEYIADRDIWSNEVYHKELQEGEELGARMKNAFALAFERGYSSAVIIGTDCPQLNEHIIQDAFSKLNGVDVVVGPALDGGYYLLGLKENHPFLFENINWSTDKVLPETINRCSQAGLKFLLLQPLHDVDEQKDLHVLKLR